jgi:hypothetical protein
MDNIDLAMEITIVEILKIILDMDLIIIIVGEIKAFK